jgi:hypothetical protein
MFPIERPLVVTGSANTAGTPFESNEIPGASHPPLRHTCRTRTTAATSGCATLQLHAALVNAA